MSVRHMLISCSLIALLGGASQGTWAMMGDDEDEGENRPIAAAQKSERAPEGSQENPQDEEGVDYLSDLRGAALGRLMHYLTPAGGPGYILDFSAISRHFLNVSGAERQKALPEMMSYKRILTDTDVDTEQRITAAIALSMTDEGRNQYLRTCALDENLSFYDRLDAAGALPETGRIAALSPWVSDAKLMFSRRLEAANVLPEKERIEVLQTLFSDTTLEVYERVNAANDLPEKEKAEALHTLALDTTLEVYERVGVAKALPEAESSQLLRTWASDPSLERPHRLDAAKALPEKERIEVLRTLALDTTLEGSFRLTAAGSLPKRQRTELMRTLGTVNKLK